MPTVFAPMAATLSATLPPDDDRWGYEIKWDGVRALAFGGPGRIRLYSRTERDITVQYPEIQPIEHQLGDHTVVLDGELVAFDDDGRPSFQRLQPRMHVTSESEIRTRQREVPVTYIVFDLLHLDGRSLFGEPYEERRRLLEELRLDGPNWQAPPYQRGDGAALLAATRAQRLEGVVAKRLTSKYRPGRRSTEWLKIKNVLRQEVVIGGWLPGQGRLEGELGSLLVGYHEPDGTLAFAGKVGTGSTTPPAGCSRSGWRRFGSTRARSPVASLSRRRSSSSPRSYARWSSPNGRAPARCATRPTRDCARTSRPATSYVRSRDRPEPPPAAAGASHQATCGDGPSLDRMIAPGRFRP